MNFLFTTTVIAVCQEKEEAEKDKK